MLRTLIVTLVLGFGLSGCASTGIALRESFGQAKREQLVSRVKEARTEQDQAKEQFASALDEFQALTGHDGGDLERLYRKLDKQLSRSKKQAGDVSKKIRDVENVANALFREWQAELGEYSSADLRRAAEQQLNESRDRYEDLLAAMKRAEASMHPVLTALNDQVLFLKHNLNASAIASLQSSVLPRLEADIARLISEMEASIAEADEFINAMTNG